MKKSIAFLACFLSVLSALAAGGGILLEAEDYKGNGYVKSDESASGGKAVFGKTWYVFAKDIPIPEFDGKSAYCFVRVRSSQKAYWFLAYDPQKAFGWFQTPGEDKWVWVCIGKFTKSDANKGFMPQIFMQRPIGSTAKTADGAMDAVIFSTSNNLQEAEKLFEDSSKKKVNP